MLFSYRGKNGEPIIRISNNLIEQVAPLIAVFFIPFLINGLGTDRFGVLTLAWMVMGYFINVWTCESC